MWLVEGASDTLIGLNTFTSKGIDIHLIHETIKLVSKNGSVIYENEADKEQGLWRLNLHDLMIINQKYIDNNNNNNSSSHSVEGKCYNATEDNDNLCIEISDGENNIMLL